MTTEIFESVWDALEDPTDATNMKLRSSLMIAITEALSEWHVTQMEAATPGRDADSAERPVARPYRQVQPRYREIVQKPADPPPADYAAQAGVNLVIDSDRELLGHDYTYIIRVYTMSASRPRCAPRPY